MIIFSIKAVIIIRAAVNCLPGMITSAKKNLGVILEKFLGGGGEDQNHLCEEPKLNNDQQSPFPCRLQAPTSQPTGPCQRWAEPAFKVVQGARPLQGREPSEKPEANQNQAFVCRLSLKVPNIFVCNPTVSRATT